MMQATVKGACANGIKRHVIGDGDGGFVDIYVATAAQCSGGMIGICLSVHTVSL